MIREVPKKSIINTFSVCMIIRQILKLVKKFLGSRKARYQVNQRNRFLFLYLLLKMLDSRQSIPGIIILDMGSL